MIKFRFYFYILSIILVLWGGIAPNILKINFGIDIVGGQVIELKSKDIEKLKNKIESLKISKQVIKQKDSLIIKSKNINPYKMVNDLRSEFKDIELIRYEEVSPSLSRELTKKSIWAVISVLILIGSYISIVFYNKRKIISSLLLGLVVILTLFHDVIATFGIYVLLSNIFSFELTTVTIIALILIAGFSVHDTIVVFDRLREKINQFGNLSIEIFDLSIKETIARSINTSLTTILAVIPLLFTIKILTPFILVIITGIIIGTYSSICLAVPLVYDLTRKNK
jgi:preprotein translocase SecF subunit